MATMVSMVTLAGAVVTGDLPLQVLRPGANPTTSDLQLHRQCCT
jgi:hypothetical protein